MKRETRMISSLIGKKTKRRRMNGRRRKTGLIRMPKILERGWTMKTILITKENIVQIPTKRHQSD